MGERRPYGTSDFLCAICQRTIIGRWNGKGPTQQLAPVCIVCESEYSKGAWIPNKGAFRDRRVARQIAALSKALSCEAAHMEWRLRWRRPHAQA